MSTHSESYRIAISHAWRRVFYRLEGYVRPLEKEPIFVLGNQKSGTSAIAALLGERTEKEYSIDLRDEIRHPVFDRVFRNELSIDNLIKKNRLDFTRKIVKEPNLSCLYPELKAGFPRAKFAMVVRDPRDNIRSLLDRHQLDGSLPSLDVDQLAALGPAWEAIIYNRGLGIEGKNHIEHMAKRWQFIAQLYQDNAEDMVLVRYEEFKKDKVGTIDALARELGLEPTKNIDSLLERPFQKPGKPIRDYRSYFGEANYATIIESCRVGMKDLRYEE